MTSKRFNRFTVPTKKYGAGKDKSFLSVVVLSSSIGHRMKTYGPKSLLKITESQTVLDLQIQTISMVYPNSEIVLVVGFEADKVIKRTPENVRIVENQLYQTTNTIEEARLALNNVVNDKILIIHGDLLFSCEAIDNLTKDGSCAVVDSHNQIAEDEVGVTVVDGNATVFSYGISRKWCQIVYLCGKELKYFKSFCCDREKRKLYVYEGLNSILDKNGIIKAIEPKDMSIVKIDSAKDFKEIKDEGVSSSAER